MQLNLALQLLHFYILTEQLFTDHGLQVGSLITLTFIIVVFTFPIFRLQGPRIQRKADLRSGYGYLPTAHPCSNFRHTQKAYNYSWVRNHITRLALFKKVDLDS